MDKLVEISVMALLGSIFGTVLAGALFCTIFFFGHYPDNSIIFLVLAFIAFCYRRISFGGTENPLGIVVYSVLFTSGAVSVIGAVLFLSNGGSYSDSDAFLFAGILFVTVPLGIFFMILSGL